MANQNTDQTINNYAPAVAIVFISLDATGAPIKDLNYAVVPDVEDISDISLSLGTTGKTGTFSILVNNENNKYFRRDDVEGEIANMREGRAVTFIGDNIRLTEYNTKKVAPKIAWDNASDFLNQREYNRVYDPMPNSESTGVDVTYFLFKNSDGKLLYRPLRKEDLTSLDLEAQNVGTNQAGFTKNTLQLEDAIPVPEKDAIKILSGSRANADFFEEFGGQLEHGRCMFEPMQLCVILMSPRFQNADSPQELVVAFTGLVDSASDEFDGIRQQIRVKGADITKWMRLTYANVNPSQFESGLPTAGVIRLWTKTFASMQGWQIIKALTVGGIDGSGNPVFGAGTYEVLEESTSEINQVRAGDKRSTLKLVQEGLNSRAGDPAAIDANISKLFFSKSQLHLQILPFDSAADAFTGEGSLTPYKQIYGSSFANWQNEYVTNLEIANEVARLTNYEFYADQFGDLWYHQPRFNNYHILTSNDPEVYVIRDEDVRDSNFTESDHEVVTSVYCSGMYDFITTPPQQVGQTAFYEDQSLVRRYGRRMESITHPYVFSAKDCFLFAKAYLIRKNASRFVGTVTILGRPELRAHMPVYVPYRNMIYYIEGIQHKFILGGQVLTTLTLRYGRKPWEVLPEILDYGIQPSLTAQRIDRPAGTELYQVYFRWINPNTDKAITVTTPPVTASTPASAITAATRTVLSQLEDQFGLESGSVVSADVTPTTVYRIDLVTGERIEVPDATSTGL